MRLTTGAGASLDGVPLSRAAVVLAREVYALSADRWATPGTARMLIRAAAVRLFPIPEAPSTYTPETETVTHTVRLDARPLLALPADERRALMDDLLESVRLDLNKQLHRIDTAGLRAAFTEREAL